MKYPTVITPGILEKNKSLTDEQIKTDIFDTEREIEDLKKMIEAEMVLSRHHLDPTQRRLYQVKVTARPEQIAERENFLQFMKGIQEARKNGINQDQPRAPEAGD